MMEDCLLFVFLSFDFDSLNGNGSSGMSDEHFFKRFKRYKNIFWMKIHIIDNNVNIIIHFIVLMLSLVLQSIK